MLPHDLVQIRPWGIDPLAVSVFSSVKHIVEYLNAQMGHADLVHVRETHGKTNGHIFRVLDAHVHLAADVAGGLLDT